MKITPEMTADSGGALLDLADYQDADGTGVKVTPCNGRARVKVNSYDPFGASAWLDRADALGLAARLCEVAAALPAGDGGQDDDGAALLAAWARCAAEVAAQVAPAAPTPADVHALAVAIHMAAQDLTAAAAAVLDAQRRAERWAWAGPAAPPGPDDDPPETPEYDPGPEVDDQGGMSEYRGGAVPWGDESL